MWNCADDNGKYHMCGTFSCVPIWGKDVSFNNKYGQYTVCTYAALAIGLMVVLHHHLGLHTIQRLTREKE